jgi:phytoene dehydrogenase-like protein
LLVEAADDVGGRVRTDAVEGFLLDRGFHIYLTSYPEALRQLDAAALDLRPFYAGALVRVSGGWHRVADPVRHLGDALASLLPDNLVGDWVDKLRVGLLRVLSLLTAPYEFLTAPEKTTLARLQELGFSDAMVQRFWRPFLGGIFFDNELQVTDRLLTFVMRSLATGENCLPSRGIGSVAKQLAASLDDSRILLNTRVVGGTFTRSPQAAATLNVEHGASAGGAITARRAVVLAVEGPEAARLLAASGVQAPPAPPAQPVVGTVCVYFAAPVAPGDNQPILYLNGDGPGRLVNNACVPSAVSPTYAPAGQALISASLVGVPLPGSATDPRTATGEAALVKAVSSELGDWFGADKVSTWRHLRTYIVPFAQPGQSPPTQLERPVRLSAGLYVCGDHVEAATLDGAMRSGRRAAEAVLQDINA